jgi:hypothetical protein
MRRKFLIIHCSDEPNNRKTTGADILRWHTAPKPKGNGWKKAGYEQVIPRIGNVDILYKSNDNGLVDSFEITNGARGFNRLARHICLIGGRTLSGEKDLEMTESQHHHLVGIVKDSIVENPNIKIGGHYNFSSKSCPNFNVEEWLISIGVSESNIISHNEQL